MIGSAESDADRLRDRNNSAGISDNSTEISDDATEIVDISANVITMLNSVLNVDWINSVPGRQIPEGVIRIITFQTRRRCHLAPVV